MKRRVLQGVLLGGASIIALGTACRLLYFGESAVTQALSAIPGVSVKRVWGNPELIADWYYAEVEIEGGPSVFIFGLARRSFEGEGGLCFFQVGRHAVRWTASDRPLPGGVVEIGWGNSFCFDGVSGEISHGPQRVFPIRVRRVRDFIENIRDIEQELARWPRCPDYLELDEMTHYRVCTNPDVGTDLSPPKYS